MTSLVRYAPADGFVEMEVDPEGGYVLFEDAKKIATERDRLQKLLGLWIGFHEEITSKAGTDLLLESARAIMKKERP